MTRQLTPRQLEILDTIERESVWGERRRPPTLRELARAVHLAPSTVVGHLDRLERLGYIVRDGQARGLWVIRRPPRPPVVPATPEEEEAAGVARIAPREAQSAQEDPERRGRTGS